MVEPWNSWDISPPPICTVKMPVVYQGVLEIGRAINGAVNTFGKLSSLDWEAALLSRFIYRFKRSLRHDKGFKLMAQINQGLHRYLKLNMLRTFTEFQRCLPKNILSKKVSHAYLPTQQMLKWVMIRILSLSKIFVRIIELAKDSGKYLYGKLLLGWNAKSMLTALGMTSRIMACAKFVLLRAIECYDCLRLNLPTLQCTCDFLPDYIFPNSLTEFIGDVDLAPSTKNADIDKIFELIDLTTRDNDDSEDDIIITNERIWNKICNVDNEVEEIVMDSGFQKSKGDRTLDNELSVVYEKKLPVNSKPSSSAKAKMVEDIGEIIVENVVLGKGKISQQNSKQKVKFKKKKKIKFNFNKQHYKNFNETTRANQ